METGNSKDKQNFIILIILFIFQTISNAFRDDDINSFNNVKFVVLIILLIVFTSEILLNHVKINYLKYESKIIFLWYFALLCISIFWMLKNNSWNSAPFITGSLRLLLPIVIACLIVNLVSFEYIYKLMYIFLIASFITFLINEIVMGRFSFNEIFTLSLSNSTGSAMESNFFSPTAISLCCFFGYFRKDKFPLILSVIFTFLTYKRLMAIFAIFLFIFGSSLKNKKVALWIRILIGFLFFELTVWYIQLNLGQISGSLIYKYVGQSVDQFTMGRSWLFKSLYFSGLPKSGLFSALSTSYRSPEMDLPVMFAEMGYYAIVVTIIALIAIAKNNLYNLVIIIFVLLEMLTSHFFDITFFWIVLYITIGLVNKDQKAL